MEVGDGGAYGAGGEEEGAVEPKVIGASWEGEAVGVGVVGVRATPIGSSWEGVEVGVGKTPIGATPTGADPIRVSLEGVEGVDVSVGATGDDGAAGRSRERVEVDVSTAGKLAPTAALEPVATGKCREG